MGAALQGVQGRICHAYRLASRRDVFIQPWVHGGCNHSNHACMHAPLRLTVHMRTGWRF